MNHKFNAIFISGEVGNIYICGMYRITGQLSLVFGILATLSVLKVSFLMLGLVFCLLGFAASIINIFIQTKYQMEKRMLTKAHLGLVLSSVPVIYIIVLVMIFKS